MECKKHLFDLEEDVTYLNMAYMSPLLRSSLEVGISHLQRKSRPYELLVEDFFEPVLNLKKSFIQLIGGENPESVAIIPSVSYALANAANNIPFNEGDEIVVLKDQFPSNIYPWRKLVKDKGGKIITISPPKTSNKRGKEWSQSILENISSRTKIVALPHVHWSDGTLIDLISIREKLDQHDGYLVIDGTQSIGALPFSLKDIKPDVLAVSAYKWLLGPYGIGVAYYNDRFDHGNPIEDSWLNRINSDDFANLLNYQDQYRSGAYRYSVGENSNFSVIPMVEHGIRQILDWEVQNIQEYCKYITESALHNISQYGFETLPENERGYHLFGISIPQHIAPKKLASFLRERKIYISVRGSYIRVSPYLYNTPYDIEFLCQSLIESTKHF